jgi:hypothetical protein
MPRVLVSNSYRNDRRIPLHWMKAGTAGVVKCTLDKALMACRADGTWTSLDHASAMSDVMPIVKNDTSYICDEAPGVTTENSASKRLDQSAKDATSRFITAMSADYTTYQRYQCSENGAKDTTPNLF